MHHPPSLDLTKTHSYISSCVPNSRCSFLLYPGPAVRGYASDMEGKPGSLFAGQAVTRGSICSEVRATWWGRGPPGQAGRESWGTGSDAQGHVAEQPLLGPAAVAVSQGGDHLVLLRRHVQALVAVHVKERESLKEKNKTGIYTIINVLMNALKQNKGNFLKCLNEQTQKNVHFDSLLLF